MTYRERRRFQQPLESFVANAIETVDLHGISRKRRSELLDATGAIIVGSDQVWRGGYANLNHQFLAYAKGYSFPKFSYAASFGSDTLIRYSPIMKRRARSLLQEFDAISVREDSGVDVCREQLGAAARRDIDPTMLLSREHYHEIARQAGEPVGGNEGHILVYVLDRSEGVDRIVEDLSSRLGLRVSLLHIEPTYHSRSAVRFRMLSIPEWLSRFSRANFVVTDSFHGTVFSIIFNKPFLALGNKERGLSRFESLLNIFGLGDRLVDVNSPSYPEELMSIDWDSVSRKLEHERSRSMNYLLSVLHSSN